MGNAVPGDALRLKLQSQGRNNEMDQSKSAHTSLPVGERGKGAQSLSFSAHKIPPKMESGGNVLSPMSENVRKGDVLRKMGSEVGSDVSGDQKSNDEDSGQSNFLDETKDEQTSGRPAWKLKICKFLDSYTTTTIMTLITIYALFFDDLRIIFFPKSIDDLFYGITLFGLVAYTIEIVLASIA